MHDEEQNMPETSKLADQNGANNLPDDIAFDNGLTELQNRAILALISTATQQEAAAKAGVNRSTLYRWLRDADFHREHLEMRNRKFSAAVGRAQFMADTSMKCLNKIILNDNTPAASRVSAIRLNLDFAARGMELDNLEHRLASLEDHAANNNHQP